jgi:hypothetical protein
VTNDNSSGLADSFKAALSNTPDAVSVAVHVSPPNANVFKYGQQIGTGDVTVNVVPGTKTTLVARLDGYLPRTVVIDGTSKSVNIALRRPEASRATVAQPAPAQKSVAASSPKSKSDNSAAGAVEPAEGAHRRDDTDTGDAPSDSSGASDSASSKPSPPPSDTSESNPLLDVDPL